MPGTRRVCYSQAEGWHLEEAPIHEARIDLRGLQLGPAIPDPRSYDERQLPPTDVSGRPLEE